MRQTNVEYLKFMQILRKFLSRGLMQPFVLMKKCAMKIERNKETNKQTKIAIKLALPST